MPQSPPVNVHLVFYSSPPPGSSLFCYCLCFRTTPQRPRRINSGQLFKTMMVEETSAMLKLKPLNYSRTLSFMEVSGVGEEERDQLSFCYCVAGRRGVKVLGICETDFWSVCVCQLRAADSLSHRLYRRRRARRAAWKVSRRKILRGSCIFWMERNQAFPGLTSCAI